MKIAICLSGLPRAVKETYPSIYEYLIKPNNIEDIFIHTWKCKDGKSIGNTFVEYTYKESDKDFILEKYKPKCYIETDQKELEEESNYLNNKDLKKYKCQCASPYSNQSQYCSIYKSFELLSNYKKKNNFNYDAIVRLRFDILFFKPIIIKNLDLNSIYVGSHMTHGAWVNDQIAIGNYDNMKKYSELWNNLRDLLDKRTPLHSEQLHGKNLQNYKIKVNPTITINEDYCLYHDKKEKL